MVKSGTPAQVKAKFKTWDDNWYGKCAAVVHTVCRHFGFVTKADTPYGSARAAYEAAKRAGNIKSKDPKKAPRGAVHYWAYVGRNSRGEIGDWGHTGVDMTSGGKDILNATSFPNDKYGWNVGTSTFAEIDGRVGDYLGWGMTYGSEYYASILDPNPPKPASAGSTTVNSEEIDMTATIRVDKKHFFTVGPEFISHHGKKDQSDITRKVMSAKDEQHELKTAEFLLLLDGLGIPRSVVTVKSGAVQTGVMNPETGKVVVDGVWSRAREASARVAKLAAGE